MNCIRIINCHHNGNHNQKYFIYYSVPGVLKQINLRLSEFNIEKQICDSRGPVAYVIVDINANSQIDQLQKLFTDLTRVPENILTRILY